MDGNGIAISVITEKAKEKQWEIEEQLIRACEFISHLDKDEEFKTFLVQK